MTPTTCTVFISVFENRRCGKPAVWSNGEFAECAEHVQDAISLSKGGRVDTIRPSVGDGVTIHRYGKTYDGRVVEVGARGAVYAEFVYDNGARRRVRVDGSTVIVR